MDEETKKLFEKFQQAVGAGVNEAQALEFFSSLTPAEYDKLIVIFEGNQFPCVEEGIRQKLLVILKTIRQKSV